MSHACTPILVGVTSPVSKILLLSKTAKFPFQTVVHGCQKINHSELAQKIYTSRDLCHMHAHQFWLAWRLRFRRYCYFQIRPNFPSMDYTMGVKKFNHLESAQKIYASRG